MDATAKDRRDTLVRLVGWPALAMAGTTGGGPALGGPGDLDPAFGEVGRAVGLPDGELWSLEVHDDESVQFGGGEAEYCGWYYYYDCGVFDTLGRLDALGGADTVFAAGNLERTYVYDTALLEDGRLVGTGFSRDTRGRDRLTVFRLLPDGALDTTFGLTGQVMLAGGTGLDTGYSVLVENDGRIVVGGIRHGNLMVVRVLANGTLDATFGTDGVFRLTTTQVSGSTRLASAPGGGYRVLANVATDAGPRCSIVGVTSNGTQDTTFGDGGVLPAPVGTPGPTYCNTFAVLPGGVMLVAGNAAPGGYVARILADGAVDPTFDPAPVADRLDDVSALAVGATGKIFVAGPGSGVAGTTIVRLLASGLLDEAFGQGGSMTLDAKSPRAAAVNVHDLQVRANDALVLAGGTSDGSTPVVARLLGDVGQSGPGVISMIDSSKLYTEQDGQAVVRVRRTGGAAGSVGVSYVARAEGHDATPGQDFTAVTGELSWANGDTTEREIAVPIIADTAEERPERFEIVLQSPTGGAGLGAMGIDVEIAGSSYPHGDFAFTSARQQGQEGDTYGIAVYRLYYADGPVSVEVRLSGGDAEVNNDFTIIGADASNTVVLTWGDDEYGAKGFNVNLRRDSADEAMETIQFELASPTGGALVAAPSSTTMSILDAPASGGSGGGNRGGGIASGLESLLLALLAVMRRGRGRERGG